jgi:hypothetical protein
LCPPPGILIVHKHNDQPRTSGGGIRVAGILNKVSALCRGTNGIHGAAVSESSMSCARRLILASLFLALVAGCATATTEEVDEQMAT